MRARTPAVFRSIAVIGAAAVIGMAAPAFAAGQSPRSAPPASSHLSDNLRAVAASSPSNVWAVGTYEAIGWQQTLIEHWNGTAWTIMPSPDPGGQRANNFLYAVAATSASSAWAVGSYRKGDVWHTLIEHWNGYSWRVTPSPSPGGVGTTIGTVRRTPCMPSPPSRGATSGRLGSTAWATRSRP